MKLLTQKQVADKLGLTRQAVTKMLSLPGAPLRKRGKYDFAEIEAYRAERKRLSDDSTNWRKECDRLKSQLLELELAGKQSKTVQVAEVEQIAAEDGAAIRSTMMAMPNALAPQLIGLTEPEHVRSILDDWCRSTLTAWAGSLKGGAAKIANRKK